MEELWRSSENDEVAKRMLSLNWLVKRFQVLKEGLLSSKYHSDHGSLDQKPCGLGPLGLHMDPWRVSHISKICVLPLSVGFL